MTQKERAIEALEHIKLYYGVMKDDIKDLHSAVGEAQNKVEYGGMSDGSMTEEEWTEFSEIDECLNRLGYVLGLK